MTHFNHTFPIMQTDCGVSERWKFACHFSVCLVDSSDLILWRAGKNNRIRFGKMSQTEQITYQKLWHLHVPAVCWILRSVRMPQQGELLPFVMEINRMKMNTVICVNSLSANKSASEKRRMIRNIVYHAKCVWVCLQVSLWLIQTLFALLSSLGSHYTDGRNRTCNAFQCVDHCGLGRNQIQV